MNIQRKVILHNKFEVKVVDARTGELKKEAVGYNVITDEFFKVRMNVYNSGNNAISTSAGLSYIGVGTGTGTPSIADTALFTPLFHRSASIVDTHYEYPTSYITKQIKINADEYNGSTITEVGLEYHYTVGMWSTDAYKLATHAMLQDSEGNIIAIEKTDVDVVYIRATFYVTFTPAGFGDNGAYPRPENNTLIQWIVNGSTSMALNAHRFPLEYASDLSADYLFTKSYSFTSGTGNYETFTWDLPVMNMLDSECNNHVIRILGIPGIGAYRFPDATVFPDYDVDHLVVGDGDGSETEFNVRCPLIKSGSAKVFVDSRLLDPTEYEFDYESNCNDSRENYYTAPMNCQMENVVFGDMRTRAPNTSYRYLDPLYWGIYPTAGNLYPSSCVVSEANPIWIDFGQAKQCNSLRIDDRDISATYLNRFVIEYSNDNENWTAVEYTRTQESYNSSITYYKWSWPMVSARYWRVYITGYNWTYYLYYGTNGPGTRDNAANGRGTFFLGKTVPGLKLRSAPAAGDTVEVSYKLNVPFKTANNLIRMTCSIILQRG